MSVTAAHADLSISGNYEWEYTTDQNEMDSKALKEVEKLIMDRDKYRLEKNYKMSDQIRDELTALGIEIEDSPQGTKWRKT
jgi:cysteinyl-tRNA synthetase